MLTRGKIDQDRTFDTPIKNEAGALLPALTKGSPAFSFTLPLPHPKGGDRAFTVLRAEPETGRFHQIRRHFARAGYPLLGDSRHGDRKLNREFAALTGCRSLFLRCMRLEFRCPETGQGITLAATWGREWHRLFDFAGACALTALPSRGPPSPS